ncbi:MAG: hypothetical protein ABJA94_09135 [Rhodoglobus sp.]
MLPAFFVTTVLPIAGLVLAIVAAIALASFLIWCVVGLVLWTSGRGLDDSAQAATDPEWFDRL